MSDIVTASSQAVGFSVRGMDEAMRLAKAMASAKMVPLCLQNSPGDCLMVIEQSMRWGMSPFAVAQATSVVKGKLCFEGKLVSAAIQSSGVLEGRLHYDFQGEEDDRKVVCSGTIKGEKHPRIVEVTLESAKTNNEWWKKTPDQMLTYHSARVWARRHTPEVMLGVYSPDELDTPKEAHSAHNNNIVGMKEKPPQKLQASQKENEQPSQAHLSHTATEPKKLGLEEAEKLFVNAIERKATLADLEKFTGDDKYIRFITEARDKAPMIAGRITEVINNKLEQLHNTAQPDPIEPGRWPEEEMPA